MKKLLLIAVIALTSFTGTDRTAYVCTGATSKVYHASKKCKGLTNCKHEIKEITESEAKLMGRTPCKLCW